MPTLMILHVIYDAYPYRYLIVGYFHPKLPPESTNYDLRGQRMTSYPKSPPRSPPSAIRRPFIGYSNKHAAVHSRNTVPPPISGEYVRLNTEGSHK